MSKTYSWDIGSMTVVPSQENLSDVVINVSWTKNLSTVISGVTYTSSINGTYACPPANPNEFTPYDQLTFNQVLAWVEGGFDQDVLNAYLDEQVNLQVNPPTITLPLPWQTN